MSSNPFPLYLELFDRSETKNYNLVIDLKMLWTFILEIAITDEAEILQYFQDAIMTFS